MAAVVNVLTCTDPVDPTTFATVEAELVPRIRAIDGFQGLHVVHTGEREVTPVILADDVGTLDRLATELGSPWMVAHVVPLLAGPPERRIGPTPASGARAAGPAQRSPIRPQPAGTFQPRPSAISLHVGQTG